MSVDTSYSLITLFQDGGWFMYPLLLCSMVGLGVIFAKAWTLRVAHRGTIQVLKDVEESIRAGDIDKAADIAYSVPGPAAAILLAGLRRVQSKRLAAGELESAITATGTIELGFLERGLIILATVANVTPLLGFMGTVAGMIQAFAAIEAAGQVEPALVAGGIKVALITTAAGLAIAIPVNIAYNFFVTRIDALIVDMERGADHILKLAWALEKEGRLEIVKTKRDSPARAARPVAGAPVVDLKT